MKRLLYLKNIYLSVLYLILAFIIFTPFLGKYFHFLNEEYQEFIMLVLSAIFGYFFFLLYKKELIIFQTKIDDLKQDKDKLGRKFNDAYSHIGNMNILMQEINEIFTKIKNYPENENDLKNTIKYLSWHILVMLNAKWVDIRIVNLATKKTIHEYYNTSINCTEDKVIINNVDLIKEKYPSWIIVVKSSQENMSINTFCIIKTKLSDEQRILIEAIINQLEMLYLISLSPYHKKSN